MIDKRFEKAIEMYSSAIAIDASNPAIYTNRSHAQFQLENYGSALMDATEALKINPSFIKVILYTLSVINSTVYLGLKIKSVI